ncbi:MAG: toll/interleukin-1 receptor domain-containing protein, partial [Pseudonocardiaceae bacterium]
MTLFVSYTRSDKALVRALKDDLERIGRSVWFDHQIHGGERWWQEIIQRIQDAEVFLFALSKDSLRSPPCLAELGYAEQLGVPVVPVQVGHLENLRFPLAEKQIVDYRERSAEAVIDLIAAVTDLSAQPRQLPNPLPTPPDIPFEYLYRIAARMINVQQIPPDDQDLLITELRRRLKTEEDEVARNDILLLLRELRARNEITVPHAAEIDEILSGIQAKKVPPVEGGATWLPPSEQWRRSRPGSTPAAKQSSTSAHAIPPSASHPRPDPGASWWQTGEFGAGEAPKAEGPRKESPKEGGGTPAWLT